MSVVMLAYGARLVRDNQVAGPDLLAFVIYQLTLGSILSVKKSLRLFERKDLVGFFEGYFSNIYIIDDSSWC
jgi:hypothetical protein